MTERTLIVMWISVGVAVSLATIITGNHLCLLGFSAPFVTTLLVFFLS